MIQDLVRADVERPLLLRRSLSTLAPPGWVRASCSMPSILFTPQWSVRTACAVAIYFVSDVTDGYESGKIESSSVSSCAGFLRGSARGGASFDCAKEGYTSCDRLLVDHVAWDSAAGDLLPVDRAEGSYAGAWRGRPQGRPLLDLHGPPDAGFPSSSARGDTSDVAEGCDSGMIGSFFVSSGAGFPRGSTHGGAPVECAKECDTGCDSLRVDRAAWGSADGDLLIGGRAEPRYAGGDSFLSLSLSLSHRDGTSVDCTEESYAGGDRPLGDGVEESYAGGERLLFFFRVDGRRVRARAAEEPQRPR